MLFELYQDNAIFLDNLVALCGADDADAQIGAEMLQRAPACGGEEDAGMDLRERQWKPAWSSDELTRVKESNPYEVMILGYPFVDEKGSSYVKDITAPVFVHDCLMDTT